MPDLVPFLRHKNTWIREATQKFFAFLQNPENKILTAAESYCLVRPHVKRVFKKAEAAAVGKEVMGEMEEEESKGVTDLKKR